MLESITCLKCPAERGSLECTSGSLSLRVAFGLNGSSLGLASTQAECIVWTKIAKWNARETGRTFKLRSEAPQALRSLVQGAISRGTGGKRRAFLSLRAFVRVRFGTSCAPFCSRCAARA